MRVLLALGAAFAITLGLFTFMATLVSQKPALQRSELSGAMVDFVRVKRDEAAQQKERKLPKKPPPPKEPPKMPKTEVAQSEASNEQAIDIPAPKLAMQLGSGGTGPFLGSGRGGGGQTQGVQSASPRPVSKFQPQIPRKARMRGVGATVVVSYTVNRQGSVEKVEIEQVKAPSALRRAYARATRKGVLRWKFKPAIKDGKPVAYRMKEALVYEIEG